jgi:hypothetical protein
MGSFSASAQINEVMRQVKEKLQARSSSVMQMFHSMDKVRRALAHSPSRPIDSTSGPAHPERTLPEPILYTAARPFDPRSRCLCLSPPTSESIHRTRASSCRGTSLPPV